MLAAIYACGVLGNSAPSRSPRPANSEGGMVRLETLIQLKFINSISFRSQNYRFELFELILSLKLTSNSLSSNSTRQHLSQQCPPHLLLTKLPPLYCQPYASVFRAYTNKTRPAVGLLSRKLSMRFPTVFCQPLNAAPSRSHCPLTKFPPFLNF